MRQRVLSAMYGTLVVGSTLGSGCASVATTTSSPLQEALSPEALERGVGASVSTQVVEPGSPVCTSATARLVELVLAQAEPKKEVDPAALFTRLGCTLCHSPGARYHDLIVQAAGKSEQELAKRIRNPEQFVPGTTMPTYASLVDEPTAFALAKWLKSGGSKPGR